ncbi:MAG: LPS assembly lipoprotein LptE [Nitrospira sp.]|nr:LPS assembly lipoprotein LptE [Nitrospira sp.]
MREKRDGSTWHHTRSRLMSCRATLARLAILACLALFVGCGYQFRVEGAGPTIGGASAPTSNEPRPRLVIRTLINNSFEPNLETRYTNYFREEFSTGSGAQIVPDSEAADLVLTGQILSVIVSTLSFTLSETFERRVEVIVSVQVQGVRPGKKMVWTQIAKGASEFFISTDLQFNRALQDRAEEQAGRFVAADLAARFLLELETSGFTKQASAPAPASH